MEKAIVSLQSYAKFSHHFITFYPDVVNKEYREKEINECKEAVAFLKGEDITFSSVPVLAMKILDLFLLDYQQDISNLLQLAESQEEPEKSKTYEKVTELTLQNTDFARAKELIRRHTGKKKPYAVYLKKGESKAFLTFLEPQMIQAKPYQDFKDVWEVELTETLLDYMRIFPPVDAIVHLDK
ncbi:hypothetical protein ACFYKX_11425 [Cytobacillus sp. FJAT-54145]|uniref:Uncharacterized protein n=1 Tax=Cytobacillus spartinae TaxID=3299023 RepID=A0ABW6KAI1_9BACI